MDLPNGDSWTYTHETNSTKITSATAPDGTYTAIAYVSGGNAAGKIDTVITYTDSGKGTTLSTVDYEYYADGRLDTASINERKQVKYEYDDNDNTTTVTERSYSSPTTVYSRTVYHYYKSDQTGEGQPASNQSFVTKKHATDTNKDQKTEYTFNTDGGNLTYVSSVKDPEGKITSYSVNTSNGRINYVDDPSGLRTEYTYNGTTGAVETVTYSKYGMTTYHEHYTYPLCQHV